MLATWRITASRCLISASAHRAGRRTVGDGTLTAEGPVDRANPSRRGCLRAARTGVRVRLRSDGYSVEPRISVGLARWGECAWHKRFCIGMSAMDLVGTNPACLLLQKVKAAPGLGDRQLQKVKWRPPSAVAHSTNLSPSESIVETTRNKEAPPCPGCRPLKRTRNVGRASQVGGLPDAASKKTAQRTSCLPHVPKNRYAMTCSKGIDPSCHRPKCDSPGWTSAACYHRTVSITTF